MCQYLFWTPIGQTPVSPLLIQIRSPARNSMVKKLALRSFYNRTYQDGLQATRSKWIEIRIIAWVGFFFASSRHRYKRLITAGLSNGSFFNG
jgi:hypothetical protein